MFEGNSMWLLLGIVVLYGLAYIFLFRPQSKKKKQEEEMRKNVKIGDEITTIGGIVGRVVNVKEEEEIIILETGVDRSKIKIKKWAIATSGPEEEKKEEKKKWNFFGRKKAMYEKAKNGNEKDEIEK